MKSWLKKILFIAVALFFIFVITNTVLAFTDDYKSFLEQAGQTGTYNVNQQGQSGFIDTFLGKLITIIISFVGVFFLGLTIYSGFQWLTAGGNEEKVSSAKKKILNGTIGVSITLLAFVITNTLFSYFNQRFLTTPESKYDKPPVIECNTNEDCANDFGGSQCLIIDSIQTCGCGNNDECPERSVCVRSQCQEVECTNNSDCQNNFDGNKCLNNQCGCQTISDCPVELNPIYCAGVCQYGD